VNDIPSLRTPQCHRFTHPENRELAYERRAVDTGHLNVSISCAGLITGDSAYFRTETRPTFAILTHSTYWTAICNEIKSWLSLRSSVKFVVRIPGVARSICSIMHICMSRRTHIYALAVFLDDAALYSNCKLKVLL
jgi:hypothetical protein